jgi:predicted site-specific integrase-resolvase
MFAAIRRASLSRDALSARFRPTQAASQRGLLHHAQPRRVLCHLVSEIGSGLNGHRSKISKLLADPSISTIVVEHRDRLSRFGSQYIEAALVASGRKINRRNPEEMKDDLVQDMYDVLTSFCARLYGRRSAKIGQPRQSRPQAKC